MTSFLAKFRSKLPTREWIANNRWTRPFAHHLLRPDLWHLNRRSVPRAVAVGLLVAPIVPVAHIFIAALAAVPARANLVIAAGVTWLINPFTIPPFYYAAYLVGTAILRLDAVSPMPQVTHPATGQATHWATWLLSKSGPLALGTLVMAVLIAAVGYVIAALGWRWSIGRKWRGRAHHHRRVA
jgi:hypothetical protein